MEEALNMYVSHKKNLGINWQDCISLFLEYEIYIKGNRTDISPSHSLWSQEY